LNFGAPNNLRGGAGYDLYVGGRHDDHYLYGIGDGFDVIEGDSGTNDIDVVFLEDIHSSSVSYARVGSSCDDLDIWHAGLPIMKIRSYFRFESTSSGSSVRDYIEFIRFSNVNSTTPLNVQGFVGARPPSGVCPPGAAYTAFPVIRDCR
jgi:hypothetical protein